MPEGAVARHRAASAARQEEAKSWGESLQRYHASRTTPAHPALLSPSVPSKFGAYNATTRRAEFDPVKQTFVDAERETRTRQTEASQSVLAQASAQHRRDHLSNHKGFDLLTGEVRTTNKAVARSIELADASHRTKVALGPDGRPRISFTPIPSHPPAREFNILTNHASFEGSAERLAKADQRAPPLHNRSEKESRAFNILTNRYQNEPHEPRAAREAEANANELRDKYFATRHYNPVTLQFAHPLEEARYQAAKRSADASHGQGALANLPPRIKRSEGACYDILTPGVVKDAAQLAVTYEAPAQRARAAHQQKYNVERDQRRRDLQLDANAAMRSTNRVSNQRVAEVTDRGYEIVSNDPLDARRPFVSPPKPVDWNQGRAAARDTPAAGVRIAAPKDNGDICN